MTSCSGTFAPLRFVPKEEGRARPANYQNGRAQKKDDLKRRIDAATKYIDLDQLALSPQCGFASTMLGKLAEPRIRNSPSLLLSSRSPRKFGASERPGARVATTQPDPASSDIAGRAYRG